MNKYLDTLNSIKPYYDKNIDIYLSPPLHYRMRCEFSYKKKQYVMYDKNNRYILMSNFGLASKPIFNIQANLLESINKNSSITKNLFQINFRSNNADDVLVTLIYRKPITEMTIKYVNELSNDLNISINIRSKKYLYKTNKEDFYEVLIMDKKKLKIYQSDKTFFQPNQFIYPKMYEFLKNNVTDTKDLLELYCGTGSFTLPLANKFNKIFASENNRESIRMLHKSISENKFSNISIARLNAEEVIEIFSGRKFNRMNDIDINSFNFSHILVDPPRSGLDSKVINLINKFKNLIYISCNPETYIDDIKKLKKFKIKKIALFDQFANTDHLEIVSILENIN